MVCHQHAPAPPPLSPPPLPSAPSAPTASTPASLSSATSSAASPADNRPLQRRLLRFPPTLLPSASSVSSASRYAAAATAVAPCDADADADAHRLHGSLDAVVQLLVWSVSPNSGLPWQMRSEAETRSTAFVVRRNRLLTNAHCVEDASAIRVRKPGVDRRYVARVVHVGDECDLALLAVDEAEFWRGVTPCHFGDFPVLQDTVFVVGYPGGGGNICMTAGVVSRIDVHAYDHSKMTSQLLAIQIDAAINDGNSGGPAFNTDGGVVGVAFETSPDSQNSGFIIPVTVVQRFLRDCEMNGRYTGMCEVRFRWQKLLNPGLRRFLGMDGSETGVLVNWVDHTGSANGVLRPGDVVRAIDGVPVSNSGTVPYLGGPVMFEFMVKNKFAGDTVALSIIRGRQRLTVVYPLHNGSNMHLVPVYERKPRPEYLIVAGLVFLTLSVPYLCDEFGRNWWNDAPKRLVHLAADGEKAHPRHQVVVLSRILTADVNDGYHNFCDLPVAKFGGVPVRNLRHLARLVRDCRDECYVFTLAYNKMVAIDRQLAVDSLPSILERHSIPAASYFDALDTDDVPGAG